MDVLVIFTGMDGGTVTMFNAFFQHIPRCLFEPIAILGLTGFLFFLCRHWKKDKAETLLFGFAIFFMIGWRVIMPINADRYALILIPPAIFFTCTALRDIVSFIRKYIPFPDCQLFLCILLIVCTIQSFHSNAENRQMFEMIKALKEESKETDRKLCVICNRDITYFLGDNYDVTVSLPSSDSFLLSDLPEADYYLLRFKRKNLPSDVDNPDFIKLKSCQFPHGKFVFTLMKRKAEK